MIRRTVCAVALVALASACVGRPAKDKTALGFGAGSVALSSDLIPPETLLERPPLNQTQAALQRGRRLVPFCQGITNLKNLAEPDPTDLNAQIKFASQYWAITSSIEDSVEVPTGPDISRRIPLPQNLLHALLDQQAEMWAFDIRLSAIKGNIKGPRISENSPERAAIDTAFVQLVNSSFTSADIALSDRSALCPAT